MTEGEKHLCDFLTGRSGGFITKLFETITSADSINSGRLAQGFPSEVNAWWKYKNESGYYEKVMEEYYSSTKKASK